MRSGDVFRTLGSGADLRSVLDSFRARYGRGASRQIARQFGVSQRTAQRALKGDTKNPKFAATDKFSGQRAANALRDVHVAHAGRVSVKYTAEDRDEGDRNIGDRQFGPEDLDEAVSWLEEGEWDKAGDAFDKALLNQYGGGTGQALTIDDYTEGLTFD